jgi:hypothetical protein
MKKALVVFAALALAAGVANANFCARDVVPSATLLFPYVVVSADANGVPDPNGYTTITDIINTSREATIVHYTVWDITSEAVVDFDEVLSGYDVHRVNWRDFLNGRFDLFDTDNWQIPCNPATSGSIRPGDPNPCPAGYTFDPFEFGPDGRSQAGGLGVPQNRDAISDLQLRNGVPPYGNKANLAEVIRGNVSGAMLLNWTHDGCGGTGNLRADKNWFRITGANPYQFYVTVDVVSAADLLFPSDDGYWSGSGAVATNRNVLLGNIVWLNAAANYSESQPAVHVEASTDTTNGGPAVFGFYEDLVNVETNREPLATALAFQYYNSPADGVTSNVILWKNQSELYSAIVGGVRRYFISDCGAYLYYAWDMDERSLTRQTEPISGLPSGGRDPNQFPYETQRVPLNNNYFDLPGPYGWMLVVFPPSYNPGFSDPTTNPSWLGAQYPYYFGWAAVQIIYGTYSTSIEAATMANRHCFSTQRLNVLGNNDGNPPVSVRF